MELLGILVSLGLLIWLAYLGWSVLVLTPLAAMLAALLSSEPVLANWTLVFMGGAAGFIASFFPIFLLGALFGKLMEDSGSVQTVAGFIRDKLGAKRAILAVVLAGALVTYGGVSLFVAIFVLVPMASALFADAGIPKRLMPAAVALGTSTFTMTMLPGTPAVQNAIPMPFFGTTPFAAPGLGIVASLITLSFGLWWLTGRQRRAQASAQAGLSESSPTDSYIAAANDPLVRERASVAHDFDPAEVQRGQISQSAPVLWVAALPLAVVLVVNLMMTAVILPALDLSYLDQPQFGPATPSAVTGIWSVSVALASAIVVLLVLNRSRLTNLRASIDAGVNASVLPIVSVASLVGFGTVVANLPAFDLVRQWVLGIGGGPLVSLALSTNVLAALTGSASGGLTIALEALGPTYLALANQLSIDPALLHRVAVIGAGTLDVLPHNGAVVTLLAVCGMTHRDSYGDIVMVSIVGALLALIAVIVLGSLFGSF